MSITINQFVVFSLFRLQVDKNWKKFAENKKREELEQIIKNEKLNLGAAYIFINNAFRDGNIETTGTAITSVSQKEHASQKIGRTKKQENVLIKLTRFFDRFFDISSGVL